MTATLTPERHPHCDAQVSTALGPIIPSGQSGTAIQSRLAAGDTSSDRGHRFGDTQDSSARVSQAPEVGHLALDALPEGADLGSDLATDAAPAAMPNERARPSLFDPTLYMLASLLDDLEDIRKANGNRTRILTATEPDEDGVTRGFGLDVTHPTVAVLNALGTQLDALEHGAILALNRAMRAHPLAAYQKQAKGVGEKQLARLLAAIGDPYLREDNGQPRTVSQLWAYCGLHTRPATGQARTDAQLYNAGGGDQTHSAGTILGPTPTRLSSLPGDHIAAKRQKGVKANWSTDAKTRAYLIATSCIKQQGEYREAYDARRAHTAETHPDWTPGHSHNDALRIVSKRILRDLWRAARDHHCPELAQEAA